MKELRHRPLFQTAMRHTTQVRRCDQNRTFQLKRRERERPYSCRIVYTLHDRLRERSDREAVHFATIDVCGVHEALAGNKAVIQPNLERLVEHM